MIAARPAVLGRRKRRAGTAPAALFLAALGCGTPQQPPAPASTATLEGGVVATVGGTPVHADTVARIAAAQHVDLRAARDLAVRDALFAAEARARDLPKKPGVEQQIASVLARRLLHEIYAGAFTQGPVTDDELAKETTRHWLELDRPEGFRTVHAVVRFDQYVDAARRKRGLEIAEEIRKAVQPVHDLAPRTPLSRSDSGEDGLYTAFKSAVDGVAHGDFEVRVEALPPITAEGETLDPQHSPMDKAFSKGAAALSARGDLSPVVESAFGAHVILLLERTEPLRVPAEQRRAMVKTEVMQIRAQAVEAELLETLRKSTDFDRNVDATLALIDVAP